jgi:hypothetical protein
MKKRGRPTKISRELVRRICGLLAKGSSIKSACIQVGLGERTYFDWQNRANANEEPFARFFSAVTRTRAHYQQKLIEIVMRAAHEDARHAEWLLERQFPNEFAPYDRRPVPVELPVQLKPVVDLSNSMTVKCRLSDGKLVDADELMRIANLNFPWASDEPKPAQQEDELPTRRPIVTSSGRTIWTDEPLPPDDADADVLP